MAVGDDVTVHYNDAVAIIQAWERKDWTQMEQAVNELKKDLKTAHDA